MTGDNRIVDEYTYGQYQDPNFAKSKLKAHWDSVRGTLVFIRVIYSDLSIVDYGVGFRCYRGGWVSCSKLNTVLI